MLAHGGESQGLEDSGAVAHPLVLGLTNAGLLAVTARSWSLVVGSKGPRVPELVSDHWWQEDGS